MPRGKLHAKRIEAAETAQRAVALRRQGMTFEQIGAALGMTNAGAHGAVKRALRLVIDEARNDAEALRALQLERLDEMYREAYAVMQHRHPLIQQGRVVMQLVLDEDGRPIPDLMSTTNPPGWLHTPVWDAAPRLAAIDRLLRIEQRRAELLGIDAPKKVAATDGSGNPMDAIPAGSRVVLAFEFVAPTAEGAEGGGDPATDAGAIEGTATEKPADAAAATEKGIEHASPDAGGIGN